MTISACGGSACISGVSRDCGHGISRLEGGAARTQIKRDTSFATPGYSISAIIPRRGRKSKIFLSVVIPVVSAAFMPFSAAGEKPAIARVARLCGLLSKPRMDRVYALPNQARYQLRYTRILNDLMGMAPPEQRADAHCTRYPCIITHRRQKGKRILIRFSLPGKLSLDIIKNENIIYL